MNKLTEYEKSIIRHWVARTKNLRIKQSVHDATYSSWYNLRYKHKVCERWQNLKYFIEDMGKKPKDGMLKVSLSSPDEEANITNTYWVDNEEL